MKNRIGGPVALKGHVVGYLQKRDQDDFGAVPKTR